MVAKKKAKKGPSAPSMFKKPTKKKKVSKNEDWLGKAPVKPASMTDIADAIRTVSASKKKKPKAPKERTAGEKHVDKIVDKMKKSKAKPLPAKKKSAKTELVEKAAEIAVKEAEVRRNAPRFGNAIMEPDDKGFDGQDSLITFDKLTKATKRRFDEGPSNKKYETAMEEIERATIRNFWQWHSWCNRLWFQSCIAELPTNRLVVTPFDLVVPVDDIDLIVSRLKKNSEFKQAVAAYGSDRYKTRLVPRIEGEVSTRTLNLLNDLMSFGTGIKTIQGFYLPNMDINDIPREVAFGAIPHLRKLTSVERFIDDLIETKKRAVINYKTLRLLGSKISEIKQTAIYKKFKQSWGLQNPLIEVTTAMSESKVRKISQLGDIIVNSTGE